VQPAEVRNSEARNTKNQNAVDVSVLSAQRELKHLGGHRNCANNVFFTRDPRHDLTACGGINGLKGLQAGEDFAIRRRELPPTT
jgi:hypothetical protein